MEPAATPFVSVGGPRSSADPQRDRGRALSTESRANQPVEAHLSTVFGADELTVVLEEEGEHARVADEGSVRAPLVHHRGSLYGR